MDEQTKQIILEELRLPWAVYAECEVTNDGKIEKFERLIAAFCFPTHAEDFIKNCLPSETVKRFKIIYLPNT